MGHKAHVEKTTEERFWEKVDKTPGQGPQGECWMWTGSLKKRYGYFHAPKRNSEGPRGIGAHRFSYELHNGVINNPEMRVCHRCDNTHCVNPAHLFLGTQRDNVLDMVAKGRHQSQKKTHCPRGHFFDEENTLLYGKRKARVCKKCAELRYLKFKASKLKK